MYSLCAQLLQLLPRTLHLHAKKERLMLISTPMEAALSTRDHPAGLDDGFKYVPCVLDSETEVERRVQCPDAIAFFECKA